MKRIRLRSKEVNKELQHYNVNLSKKDQVELVENGNKLIVVNKQPYFFYHDGKPLPTLKYLQEHQVLKKITVDMGAIKFVINGADVMRPGITEIDQGITKNDFIMIVDENNKKPLAVGIALFDSEEMKSMDSGKVIKNIHYVGDELWRMEL